LAQFFSVKTSTQAKAGGCVAKRYLVFVALLTMTVSPAPAQDARTILQTAAATMGSANLKSIQYSGTGWVGAVGQSYNAGLHNVGDGWPQFDLTSYTRTIDYDARSLQEDVARTQGNNPPRGGGGTPLQGEQRQVSVVSGNFAWNMQGNRATPVPAAVVELRQLDIVLTPHGFLKAAMASSNPTAFSRRVLGVDDLVKTVTVVSFTVMGKYRVNGMFNAENLLEHVQTWVPSPVLGDMLYEIRYTDYKDFGGVKFPTNIHGHTGAIGYDFTRGFWNLDPNSLQINVTNVQPNLSVAALTVPDAVRQSTIEPAGVESQRLANGVWLVGGGSHNSVAVEFRDFVAIVEAPLNEERSLAVIGEVNRLVPNKPIQYLVNTHHHFDHLGGLRTYWSEGATIITHLANRDFYERAVLSSAPRTLEPDRLSLSPVPTTSTPMDRFETVTRKFTLSDGNRTMEVHALQGVNHAEFMLIAYLPAEKILVNADLYSPPAPGAQPPASPTAGMLTLYRNMERLKLDVTQHVPIHGRVGANEEFLRIVRRPNPLN
jgi:glyoxylase-like metal-dependent hydrolase (beta-lactamase superfamily II)